MTCEANNRLQVVDNSSRDDDGTSAQLRDFSHQQQQMDGSVGCLTCVTYPLTADGAGAGSAAAEKHLLRWTLGLAAEQAGASTAAATDLETVLKERDDLARRKAKVPAALRKAMLNVLAKSLQSVLLERWCLSADFPPNNISMQIRTKGSKHNSTARRRVSA